MALRQRFLYRVQVFAGGQMQVRVLGQVLHRPQRHAIDGMGQPDAAVDGFVTQLRRAIRVLHALADDHGAGPAVPFATAFFGAGAMQVLSQHFQQRAVRGNIVQRHALTATQKMEWSWGHRLAI